MISRLMLVLILIAFLTSCSSSDSGHYQGYVEADLIYLASPFGGYLVKSFVERGQKISEGQLLFKLDDNPEAMLVQQETAELAAAKSTLKDLENPKRAPEITAVQAQIQQVGAELSLAKIRVQRYKKLFDRNAADKDDLDEAVARKDQLQERKAELQANLELALQGSRAEQINSQRAKIEGIKAKLKQVNWQLAQKTLRAPAAGVIEDTFYRVGEYVPSQKVVMSLLTPENTRIEFFIPVKALASVQLRQKITFSCSGCLAKGLGKISYISPEAEYIPPLVYSRENEDKLVYRVQASIDNPSLYKPGQPILIVGIKNE